MPQPQEIKRPAERPRSADSGPSPQDEIRFRAFELYQQRGGEDNHAIETGSAPKQRFVRIGAIARPHSKRVAKAVVPISQC
jgi:hypothetical protein